MSSPEIAELIGKRHDHVMADIRSMLTALGILNELSDVGPSSRGYYVASNGERNPRFNLPKRECLILVSGYSVELRAAIIDRWAELEAKAAGPVLPNFANPAEAARAWAERYEGEQKASAAMAQGLKQAARPDKVSSIDHLVRSVYASLGLS